MRYQISHFGETELAVIRVDSAAEALDVIQTWYEATGAETLFVEDEDGDLVSIEDLKHLALH